MVTVLLVDDEPLVRRGLWMRLSREPDLAVVGEAGDGAAALQLARALQPDVVLLELTLPDLDGIVVTAALRAAMPRCAVIIHSLHDSDANRVRARAAGATAFTGKWEGVAALLATIRRVVGEATT